MMKFDYLVVEEVYNEDLELVLKNRGKEGWDLSQMIHYPPTFNTIENYKLIFKRIIWNEQKN